MAYEFRVQGSRRGLGCGVGEERFSGGSSGR